MDIIAAPQDAGFVRELRHKLAARGTLDLTVRLGI